MASDIEDQEQKQASDIEQSVALFNYATIGTHATIGIVVTNEEGTIINFNKFAEKQFGYSEGEILGKKVEVLLPPSVHNKHLKYRKDYYNEPEVRAMGHGRHLLAQKKDGGTFPVEVSLSPYTIDEQTFVIAFVIDITVRKEQEEMVLQQKQELENVTVEIKRLNSELEQKISDRTKMLQEALTELEKSKGELNEAFEAEKELSEMKSRFVTMASHEFRTPLSTILSSTYLVEKYNELNPNPKIKKHVQKIKGAVSGMKGILEDFLSLGRLEEGHLQAKMECVSAGIIFKEINSVIQELDVLLKTGQEINLNSLLETDVWVDRSLLKNILVNLISNSIKFTTENSAISITTSLKNENLVISVTDFGIGISEEDQHHLFKRFFRARNAINIQGTGLGLHIVGKYVELMNGRIEIKSKIDDGSTFTVCIPQLNPLMQRGT